VGRVMARPSHQSAIPSTVPGSLQRVFEAFSPCFTTPTFTTFVTLMVGLIALVTTDLTTPVADIVHRYAARWAFEVAFEDAKQITGVGEACNRTPAAVERTVVFGLYTQSIVIIWRSPNISPNYRPAHPNEIHAVRLALDPGKHVTAKPELNDRLCFCRTHVPKWLACGKS
jgi:hypothetical protein